MSPTKAARLPYPYATITAWDQDKNRALAETKADKDGDYCIVYLLTLNKDCMQSGSDRRTKVENRCSTNSVTTYPLGSNLLPALKGSMRVHDESADRINRDSVPSLLSLLGNGRSGYLGTGWSDSL
jgi:hypothetical protein